MSDSSVCIVERYELLQAQEVLFNLPEEFSNHTAFVDVPILEESKVKFQLINE